MEEKQAAKTSDQSEVAERTDPFAFSFAEDDNDAESVIEEVSESVEGTEDVDTTEAEAEGEQEDGEQAEDGETDAEVAKPQKQPQTSVQNAEFARKRREAERLEAEKKAFAKGVLSATGNVNPYTNKMMVDQHDIDEYLRMAAIEKQGKDPIADYSEFAKESKRREETAMQAHNAQERFINADAESFKTAHPDVDMSKLIGDRKFVKFASSRLGAESMETIYADWLDIVGDFESTAQAQAANIAKRQQATPGSLSGGGTKVKNYESMSDRDFERVVAAAMRGDLTKS